ncbi:hypothetical protein RhiirA4_545510 [Rhizophagus irregularis]|uniref:Uncharacterized protein n=1 Tax=Rhizophagus irregularis TaxID=588596 RepID=A0A2I1GTB3_9GLOM|nr:hypothetical protein RhiirA4_545510 [Rhizophagus irregularis]
MTVSLEFCLNACPICLICLDCQTHMVKNALANRKGATNQKVVLDSEFVDWSFANISKEIELLPTKMIYKPFNTKLAENMKPIEIPIVRKSYIPINKLGEDVEHYQISEPCH